MTFIRTFVSVLSVAGVSALLAAASGVHMPWHPLDDAALRLSWSVKPERIEQCRALTPEEIAARPEHMRQAMECEGKLATYDLTVTIDDSLHESSVVHGSGIRRDRPMFLLRNYRTTTGPHRVQVTLTRREKTDSPSDKEKPGADSAAIGAAADRRSRELEQHREMVLNSIPSHLTLDTVLTFPANGVALITIEDRALTVRSR